MYLILLLSLSLFSQKGQNSSTVNNNIFKAHAKVDNLPEPFVKLDSVINKLYIRGSQGENITQIINEYSDEELIEYAKLLALINYYPREDVSEYFAKSNAPFDEQFRRKQIATKEGKTFNEVRQDKPGALCNLIEKKIYERLPWEWTFRLKNKYILYVKVLNVETRRLGTHGHQSAPYYYVEVLDDLKGNFSNEKNIEIAGIHVRGKMAEGENYILFIKYKHPSKKHYSLRGLATNDYGFLPVVDNNIIDENNVLHTNSKKIDLNVFKSKTTLFYKKIKGVHDVN